MPQQPLAGCRRPQRGTNTSRPCRLAARRTGLAAPDRSAAAQRRWPSAVQTARSGGQPLLRPENHGTPMRTGRATASACSLLRAPSLHAATIQRLQPDLGDADATVRQPRHRHRRRQRTPTRVQTACQRRRGDWRARHRGPHWAPPAAANGQPLVARNDATISSTSAVGRYGERGRVNRRPGMASAIGM